MVIEQIDASGIRPDKSAIVDELSYTLCSFYNLRYFNFEFDLPSVVGCFISASEPFSYWNTCTSHSKILLPKAQKWYFGVYPAAFDPMPCT